MNEKEYDDEDYDKAEYLVKNGYFLNISISELAKVLYNQRIQQNQVLLNKVYE